MNNIQQELTAAVGEEKALQIVNYTTAILGVVECLQELDMVLKVFEIRSK